MPDKEDSGQESIEETLKRLLGSFPEEEKTAEETAGPPETLDTPFSEEAEEDSPNMAAPSPEAVEEEKPRPEWAGILETLAAPSSEAVEEENPPPEWAGVLETLATPFQETVEEEKPPPEWAGVLETLAVTSPEDTAPPLPPMPEPLVAYVEAVEPTPEVQEALAEATLRELENMNPIPQGTEMVGGALGVAAENQASPSPSATEAAPPLSKAADQRPEELPPPPTMFEGTVEIKTPGATDVERLYELERRIKTHKDLRWLGTRGSSRQGTVIQIELIKPLPLMDILDQMAPVQKVEIPKGAKNLTELLVTLGEKIPTEAGAPQVIAPPPATSPAGKPTGFWRRIPFRRKGDKSPLASLADRSLEAVSPESSPPSPGKNVRPVARRETVRLEVSPLIMSLGELTRFEQLLSSLGSRPTSVATVNDASGVLFTLEDTSREAVINLLRGSVPGAVLEETADRIRVRLPAGW